MTTSPDALAVHLVLAQHHQSYPGQIAPTVLEAWDAGSIDQNDTGWKQLLAGHWKAIGSDYENVTVLRYALPASALTVPDVAQPSEAQVCQRIASGAGQLGVRLFVAEQRGGGERWIEVVDAWDEHVIDDNHDGYRQRVQEHAAQVGDASGYGWLRLVDIAVENAVIEAALAPWMQLHPAALLP